MTDKENVVSMSDQNTAPAKKRKKHVNSGARVKSDVWVPTAFIKPAVKRLNITLAELGPAVGISQSAATNYLTKGTCPMWFKKAVNGLIAELSLPDPVSGPIRNLPAVIEPTPEQTVLYIRVPRDQTAVARAHIGALGWAVVMQGDE